MTKRLLVVDWDYFFPTVDGPYETTEHGRGSWEWMLYDWGHSEGRMSAYFQQDAWLGRAAAFQENGLPLPDTSGEELTFWKRFRFAKDAQVYVADSNSQAAHAVVAEGVNAVYLYDAHHDSGYKPTALDSVREQQQVTCENWMLAYYEWGVRKLVMRYPRWRVEAFGVEPDPAIPIDRQFDDGSPVPVTFHRVFICRSAAWTPPWLDPKFHQFVDACPAGTARQFDGMAARQWSDEMLQEAVTRTEEINAMLQQHARQPSDPAVKVLGEVEL